MKKLILKGDIIFTPTKEEFKIYEDSYLVSEDGKIVGYTPSCPPISK